VAGNSKSNRDSRRAIRERESQEDGGRWPTTLAVGAVLLLLSCICVGSIYVLWPRLDEFFGSEPAPLLEVPTRQTTPEGPSDVIAEPTTSQPDQPTPMATEPGSPVPPTAVPTVALPHLGNVAATRFTTPPTIDGDLSEWSGLTGTNSSYRVYNIADWDGSDDLDATWRVGWDDSQLYFAVGVVDDIHVQEQSGNLIYKGDSLDIQFDTDRNGDYGDGLSPDDIQITISPGNFSDIPESAFRFRGNSSGRIVDYPGTVTLVAARKSASGYTVEVAIPWSDLQLEPRAGLVIGIALNADDNDTVGEARLEVMKSHVPSRTLTDPSGWGTLQLQS